MRAGATQNSCVVLTEIPSSLRLTIKHEGFDASRRKMNVKNIRIFELFCAVRKFHSSMRRAFRAPCMLKFQIASEESHPRQLMLPGKTSTFTIRLGL
jgi:hypothetical protein